MANYYGSDSGWNGAPQNPCAVNPQFYIGRIGINLTANNEYFNSSLAQELLQSTGNKVYGYWFIYGPDSPEAQNYETPYEYGQAQGMKAKNTRDTKIQNAEMNGLGLFGDVEGKPGQNYWSSDLQANQDVINGFLSVDEYFGLYSAPCAWQDITGSVDWYPTLHSTWKGSAWTFQKNYGYDPGCIDGNWSNWIYNAPCPTSETVAQGFGNLTPVFWQYATNIPEGDYLLDLVISWTLPD